MRIVPHALRSNLVLLVLFRIAGGVTDHAYITTFDLLLPISIGEASRRHWATTSLFNAYW